MINKIESFVFNIVKKNATIKNILVRIYQLPFSVIGMSKGRIKTELEYSVIEEGFFGFHDRPSMNTKFEVLSHVVSENNTARIKLTDLKSGKEHFLANTPCWNNQQGSLMTWYDDNTIIYNDYKYQPETVLLNVRTGENRVLPFHFFSVSKDGSYLSSISFLRFGIGLDGYGYDNIKYPENYIRDAKENISTDEISDMFIYDVKSEIIIKRFKLTELLNKSKGLIQDGYFYFSHILFSPDSKKVLFLLRSSNKKYNSSQLFFYDIETDVTNILPTDGMVSHLSWLGDSCIIAYCKVINSADGYYKFDTLKSTESPIKININNPERDGHPNSFNSQSFVTDTYPDRERRQHLYKIELSTGAKKELLSVYSPMKFRGNNRVDLHPRYSLCGDYITIDSSHNNSRQQIILKLRKNK